MPLDRFARTILIWFRFKLPGSASVGNLPAASAQNIVEEGRMRVTLMAGIRRKRASQNPNLSVLIEIFATPLAIPTCTEGILDLCGVSGKRKKRKDER
jgi:hypothetical protein